MSLTLISFPQIITKQATAPTITTSSVLWRDTDDDVLYFSDGTSWKQFSSASDSAGFESMISQMIINVLKLSAEGTLTAPDYSFLYCDYFADADGQDGTINDSDSTGFFSSSSYANFTNATYDSDSLTPSLDTAVGATSTKYGVKITTDSACWLKTVTKNSNVTATKCYLQTNAHTDIVSTDFVGDVATFNTDNFLANASTYYIVVDNAGASYIPYKKDPDANIPYNGSLINITADNQDDSGVIRNIEGITADTSQEGYVLTNVQSLPSTPAYVYLYCDKTLVGTGAVSIDVSFDNGVTWDSTGNDLNTKVAVVDGSGKNMILKINLDGEGDGNRASITDYAVLLWSS